MTSPSLRISVAPQYTCCTGSCMMATGAAWWWTRSQTMVLRVPAGFLLFLTAGLVLGPLSWWSGNKLVVAAEAAVLAVGAKYLGALWSGRLQQRLAAAPALWYLDQSINLIEDIFRWLAACIITWFAVGILPLVFMLPASRLDPRAYSLCT